MGDRMREILTAATSGDNVTRNRAESAMRELRHMDPVHFLLRLSQELAAPDSALNVRMMAGLALKNNLADQAVVALWMETPSGARNQIKETLLSVLSSDQYKAAQTSAQAMAKLACIELPHGQWPELIPQLTANVQAPSPVMRRSTLDLLGYMCEHLHPRHVSSEEVNGILTAVVQGMNPQEGDLDVRLAGTSALNNALAFLTGPMDRDEERDYIMTMVCENTKCQGEKVRKAAMECLVKIVANFYAKMSGYMSAAFTITFEAIQGDAEAVALQAIEFWSTICEVESYLDEQFTNGDRSAVSANYINNNLEFIAGMLLQTLTRQQDDQTPETWNISMAAGTCLGLVAMVSHDAILNHVVPWVLARIESQDWHEREAALFAFGSVLEGVKSEQVAELINTGISFFANLMADPQPLVSESAGWTLGRICHYHAHVVSEELVPPLVDVLVQGLARPPRVASNCCWALNNLFEAFEDKDADPENPVSNALEPFLAPVIEGLLGASARTDADEFNLCGSAYTAINVIVQTCPKTPGCLAVMSAAFVTLGTRLEETFSRSVLSANDAEEQSKVQSLICAVLQVITQKVDADIAEHAEGLMQLYIRVFQCSERSSSPTVHEECLLAVGALAGAIGKQFVSYMNFFKPYLLHGLRNYEQYQVCTIAVGVVGDLCRALEREIQPYAQEIMALLFDDVKADELNRDVKPAILSSFGDMALALEDAYQPYHQSALGVLEEASGIQLPRGPDEPEENVTYMNELRENVLEGYTGIFQGMNAGGCAQMLLPYARRVMEFISEVCGDPFRNEALMKGAVGVLGDVAHALGTDNDVRHMLTLPWVQPLLDAGLNTTDAEARETAEFAQKAVRKALVRR